MHGGCKGEKSSFLRKAKKMYAPKAYGFSAVCFMYLAFLKNTNDAGGKKNNASVSKLQHVKNHHVAHIIL